MGQQSGEFMKAVMPDVPDFILQWRRKTGADQWDEMWAGVLHTAPAPSLDRQDLRRDLETWLHFHWARPRRGKVYSQVNVAPVGGWPHDYRIPDLLLLSHDRLGLSKDRL